MPSYQATPTASTVSHVASNRSTQRGGASDRVLAYSSSTSSLSQAPPQTDSHASTLVEQEGGGVRGEEPQPVVVNSVYINGTGWASQVQRKYCVHVNVGLVEKSINVALIFLIFSSVVFW